MKNVIRTLLVICIIQSCSKKNIDNDLLGNWSSTKSANIVDLEFFKDSLIQNSWERTTKFSWTSNGSKIYYTQLTNLNPELETDFILEYKLNAQKDTLFVKTETDSSFTNQFLKIKNGLQYLKKNINLDFDLPKKENGLISSGNKKFDFNIYVGFKNGKLVAKTDRYINLDGIQSEIYDLIFSIKEQEKEQIKYLLFADKRVPEKEIDSIKNLLKETTIKKIFRVYTNEQVDYEKTDWKDELNWFGEYE
ncbi:hypothetical protein [Aequorivita sediminis]|uniref:hypothetical protein n=1 Tax=Aequorivita sediminis TaxID=3073653 RepID=UPI0028AFF82B|nr:hypothetical protein [Aequorivita sp. F6058]